MAGEDDRVTSIRVLIADDHPVVRSALSLLLQRSEGIDVVGEVANGSDALALAAQLRPDVLVTDLFMPGLTGFELATGVRSEGLDSKVVVFTGFLRREYVARALCAGVTGFVTKPRPLSEVAFAIRAVAEGGSYFSPGAQELVSEYVRSRAAEADPLERFTSRQREILRLLAEGESIKGIADRLGVNRKTVEAHRAHIMESLGTASLAVAVRYAIRVGIVPPDH